MKKMYISKRGFTLTEIIVVVAIMVVVASAAFVGIAVTINNANNTTERLERENGSNFENEAWDAVDNITSGAAKFFDISKYKPKNPTNTPTPTPEPTSTPIPIPTYAEATSTPVPTKAASATNTPVPTSTTAPTNTPIPPQTGSGAGTVTAPNTSSNVSGSSLNVFNNWGSGGQATVSLPSKAKKVVLYVPNGVTVSNAWENGISNPSVTTNGNYVTIDMQPGQSTKTLTFQASWSNGAQDMITVYSYTT